jgi:gluconolactonase
MVYEVKADGRLDTGRVFVDGKKWTAVRKGAPDGMKIDRNGNIFGSGPEGIYVFAPDGTHLGTILTGVPTANCAWGDDGSTFYITANTAVYRIRLSTRGAGW